MLWHSWTCTPMSMQLSAPLATVLLEVTWWWDEVSHKVVSHEVYRKQQRDLVLSQCAWHACVVPGIPIKSQNSAMHCNNSISTATLQSDHRRQAHHMLCWLLCAFASIVPSQVLHLQAYSPTASLPATVQTSRSVTQFLFAYT